MAGDDQEQVRQVAEAIGGLLAEAVQATVDTRSPEPARECVAELLDVDRRATPGEQGGPAELMATVTLVRWSTLVRTALAARPDPPDTAATALAWVGEALGTRCRARARYTSGALRSEDEAGEIMVYAAALRSDFLPSLIWLVAGAVAAHGAGRSGWLRELEGLPLHT